MCTVVSTHVYCRLSYYAQCMFLLVLSVEERKEDHVLVQTDVRVHTSELQSVRTAELHSVQRQKIKCTGFIAAANKKIRRYFWGMITFPIQ